MDNTPSKFKAEPKIKKMIGKLKKIVLDTLFPIACLGCQKNDLWLCEECIQKIPLKRDQVCPACEREISLQGLLCKNCRKNKSFHMDGLISSVFFDEPIAKKLIYNLKYRFVRDASDPLSRVMIRALILNEVPIPQVIVPVPLHPRRLRWRGFNQAEILAEKISKNYIPLFPLPVFDILARRKYNKPQMKVKNYQDRLENVKDVFCLKPDFDSGSIRGKKLLLVDDIATTGATLWECAKVLKENGAKKVFAVVIARQTFHPVK